MDAPEGSPNSNMGISRLILILGLHVAPPATPSSPKSAGSICPSGARIIAMTKFELTQVFNS